MLNLFFWIFMLFASEISVLFLSISVSFSLFSVAFLFADFPHPRIFVDAARKRNQFIVLTKNPFSTHIQLTHL